MNALRLVIALLAMLLATACSSELEFADWRLPVPEGLTVHDYAPVLPEDRQPGTVTQTVDLVLGDDLSDPDGVIYQPSGIAAAPDGTIYVGDSSDRRIHMFAPDGTRLGTFGKEGQGPAEFGSWSGFMIAGDNLVFYDSRNRRLSIWTLDGEYVGQHVPTERISGSYWAGLADGSITQVYNESGENREYSYVLLRRDLSGKELGRMLTIEVPPQDPFMISDAASYVKAMMSGYDDPFPMMTVGAGETIFVASRQEYQVLAFSGSGQALWGARVAWPRPPFPELQKRRTTDNIAERFREDLRPSQFDWPPHNMALYAVAADGAGRLYVFPMTEETGEQEDPDRRPVDVFSPDGEFLAAGWVEETWTYAQGEYVYGIGVDPITEERVAIRYRIEIKER